MAIAHGAEGADMPFVNRNTFVCALGAEALSPAPLRHRRACSEIVTSASASSLESSSLASNASEAVIVGDEEDSWCSLTSNGSSAGGAPDAARDTGAGGWALASDAVGALPGGVCEVAESVEGCAKLEELIGAIATGEAAFIARELCAAAPRVALSVHGSSLMCRLLEYCGDDECTEALIDAAFAGDAASMCCHKFGHQVAMSVLSNGAERHKYMVAAALLADEQRFARHRYASNVIVQALTLFPCDACAELARRFVQHKDAVECLACHTFGVHVVRALLESSPFRNQVFHLLSKVCKRIGKDKFGKILLEEVGLKPPRSTPPGPAAPGGAQPTKGQPRADVASARAHRARQGVSGGA